MIDDIGNKDMYLKKGDKVKIISGNDRGKEGKILEIFRGDGRIMVDGVNIKKKHARPRRQGQKGERIEKPAPFEASRAMIVCGSCGNATRVGLRVEGGKKIRTCKKCKKDI